MTNIILTNSEEIKNLKKQLAYYTNIYIEELHNIKIKKYKPIKKYTYTFVCSKCEKIFSNKRNYDSHVLNKICEKIKIDLKCDKCNKIFTDIRSLNYHNKHNVCNKKLNLEDNNNLFIKEVDEQKDLVSEPIQELDNKQIKNKFNEQIQELIKNQVNEQIQELINKLNNKADNEINQETINELLQNTNDKAFFKKTKISIALKRKVWHKWIGIHIGQTKCLCCKMTDIEQFNFSCGHIIPESKGGTLDVENLRPICSSCNSSMGNENMFEFMRRNKL